ncbi:MAG: hypothetical protein Q9159_002693 [Coniocarpon cinnabarinum]
MRHHLRNSEDARSSPFSPPSRSPSISSLNSPSTARFTLIQPPPTDPPPAFVAAAAASEIVTNLRSRPDREDGQRFDNAAIVSEDALASINAFLDFLLYNMLVVARSSALAPVRLAVDQVVKGKMAQHAIRSGELELEELVSDEDEHELASMRHGLDAEAQWDADMVWKRTRLKIFTMMRLSEIEDDDEDDEDELDEDDNGSDRPSRGAGLVSWPAKIFLTGALERIAEQCIKDAGESAYNRVSISRPGTRDGFYDDDDELLVIRDQDVKKLALSQLVGRIWRTWKHSLPRGSPRMSLNSGRQFSHERGASVMSETAYSRRPSNALQAITDQSRDELVQEYDREPADDRLTRTTSEIRTPRSPRRTSDQSGEKTKPQRHAPRRSRSFGRFPVAVPGRSDAVSWRSQRGSEPLTEEQLRRMRSSSLPPPTGPSAHLTTANRLDEDTAPSAPSMPTPAKKTSRNSRDLAAEAAKAAPQAAEATMANKAGKRMSRDSNKRRSKEVRRSREVTAPVEPHDPELAAEPAESDDVHQDAPLAASVSVSDEEYDPFRADAATPPPVMSSRAGPLEHVPPHAPSVQDTLRKMSQRTSMSPSPHREPGATATLSDGAVSSAMFGTTSQQRRAKKPAPLDMSSAGTSESHSATRDVRSQQHDRAPSDGHQARAISMVSREAVIRDFSPSQASAGRGDTGSRTPSSSKLNRMGTSDTGSAPYHTPRGSPTAFEERPGAAAPTSDPSNTTATATTSSPRTHRATESTTSRTSNKAPVTREHDKAASVGTRSDKEFHELMSGNETVKRSLTPKALTDIEVRKSPLSYHPTHAADAQVQAADSSTLRQQQVRSTYGPPSPMATQFPISEASESADISSADAVVPASKKASNIGAIRRAAEEARIAEAGSSASSSSRPPRSPHTARDAREQSYRTNDMADFIRSTAPTSPDQAPKLVSPASTSPTASGSKSAAAHKPPTVPSVKSVVPNTSRKAPKKLMRPAKMEHQANDDLISFLREGPPGAQVNKSKSLETTASRANDGMGLGQLSPANRSSSQMSQSINESVASHSALLPKASERSPMMNAAVPRSGPPAPKTGDGSMPQRKQKRGKDPYAIESDDEDTDVLTGLPKKADPSEAMSMADFLRSTAPPDDNQPSSLASSATAKRLTSPPGRNRLTSPPRGKRGSASPFGTQSTAVGGPAPGPGPKLHKTIPSNEEIKRDPGDLALPQFLKEDRQLRPRESYDNESPMRKGRSSSKDAGRAGMRGLFKRIGVNG